MISIRPLARSRHGIIEIPGVFLDDGNQVGNAPGLLFISKLSRFAKMYNLRSVWRPFPWQSAIDIIAVAFLKPANTPSSDIIGGQATARTPSSSHIVDQ
jgi:hypothetical protein